jgi:hypothetical protein
VLLAILVFWGVGIYNRLVTARNGFGRLLADRRS